MGPMKTLMVSLWDPSDDDDDDDDDVDDVDDDADDDDVVVDDDDGIQFGLRVESHNETINVFIASFNP